ncbi:MAG: hypothetical protein KGI66_03520, partial [Patescibacteria group bacterium]|nr:hypothetical protein [Patescibacteria group bacterium]
EARIRARNYLLKQRPAAGLDTPTIDSIDRLGEQGHLANIEKFRPTTYREALAATRAYMGAYFMKTIGPALLRHGDAAMDLQPVADAINALHNPNIEQVLPEDIPAIDKEVARFKGKQIPIKDGYELLTRLNAATRNLESMTPADQAAAMNKSMALNSLSTATDALRNQIYGTFDKLGEHGIESAQKEYGDLMSWRQFLDKNIATSEKAQARMPGLGVLPLLFRSFTRRPLLAEAGIGSTFFEPEVGARALAPLATVPAIEFLTTLGERAKVPNALLRQALSAYGKTEGAGIPTTWEPQLALPPAAETPHPPEWGRSAITGKPRGTMPGPTVGPIYAPYRGEPAGSEATPMGGRAGYPTAPQPTPEGQSTAAPTPISFAGAKAPLTPGDIVTLASRVAREAAGEGAPAAPVTREPIFDISRIRQEEAAMRGPKAGTTISLSPQARELLRQILEGKK